MIWLKRGIAEDDQALGGALYSNVFPAGSGHIDMMVRFVSADTIVLADVTKEERDTDPVMRTSYERLEENYRILQNATDRTDTNLRSYACLSQIGCIRITQSGQVWTAAWNIFMARNSGKKYASSFLQAT